MENPIRNILRHLKETGQAPINKEEDNWSSEKAIEKIKKTIKEKQEKRAELLKAVSDIDQRIKSVKSHGLKNLGANSSETRSITKSLQKDEMLLLALQDQIDELEKEIKDESLKMAQIQLSAHRLRSEIFSRKLKDDLEEN